ncbi:MAG: CRISPR-associated protein Cas4 [Candidatus Lokiarchaeota archaeon]|nr:CRISPR-associated protein Cas4 [Candidatus Lokiarchaeota archaeon]
MVLSVGYTFYYFCITTSYWEVAFIDPWSFTVISLIIGILLIVLGTYYSWKNHHIKRSYHIPDGKITYADLNISEKTLFSPRYRLAGKPDYIVKQQEKLLPVEVKSGAYSHPQFHHIMQLTAYCVLLEDTFQTFVPQGLLVYPSGHHMIMMNPKVRFQLEQIIHEINYSKRSQTAYRNHHDKWKCRSCSLRQHCMEKLI